MAIFNIALGLLCGSVFGVKQVGGICGALLTNLSAWLSGLDFGGPAWVAFAVAPPCLWSVVGCSGVVVLRRLLRLIPSPASGGCPSAATSGLVAGWPVLASGRISL